MLWFLLGRWFVVDCFHWRGHVGCPLGYCLDIYKHMSLREINSQVNEQANAGLQRIREQLAYMTPQNFMFTITLFISVKSMDIQRKLDVSSIRIQVVHFSLIHIVIFNLSIKILLKHVQQLSKCHPSPTLANIASCQNWQIPSDAEIGVGTQLKRMSKSGKF